MLADKRVPGEIKTKTAHETITPVGEPAGDEFTGISAMGHKGVEQEPAIVQVQDKKSFLGGGERKINDRKNTRVANRTRQ